MKKIAVLSLSLLSFFAFSQKKWSLQECVNYAIENNLQVIQNNFNIKTQDNSLKIAKREYLPSVSGNIKKTQSPQNKSLSKLIPFINEATIKARQEYEVKQAQLLQKEMMNLM